MKQNVFRLTFLSLFLLGGTAFAGTVSVDNVFVASDQYSSDFYSRLNRNFSQIETQGVNNIEGATNVKNQSLLEINMADEINPRVRTAESASCPNYVYSGLLPVTGASLTTFISAGTGYPLGYRIAKASGTAHTYTASVWTWVDLDTLGNFHYTETAFGSAAPAVFANSMRLAVVSSDTSTVNTVTDLRVTSCTTGNLSNFTNATGEASIDDILKNGLPNGKLFYSGGANTQGYFQGAGVSYNNATSFNVAPGSIYINGHYRSNASTTIVPITANVPGLGISGIDSGTPVQNTIYKVYAVADKTASKNFSVSFGTAPSGLTNYREIGQIQTATSDTGFVSIDVASVQSFDWILAQQGVVSNANSFTISNLSSKTRYKLVYEMMQNTANGAYYMQFNSDSGANYKYQSLSGYQTNASGQYNLTSTSIPLAYAPTDVLYAGDPIFGEIDIQQLYMNDDYVLVNYTSGSISYNNGPLTSTGQGQYSGVTSLSTLTITTSAGTMTGQWYLYELS